MKISARARTYRQSQKSDGVSPAFISNLLLNQVTKKSDLNKTNPTPTNKSDSKSINPTQEQGIRPLSAIRP
jgi:hypothetical protein